MARYPLKAQQFNPLRDANPAGRAKFLQSVRLEISTLLPETEEVGQTFDPKWVEEFMAIWKTADRASKLEVTRRIDMTDEERKIMLDAIEREHPEK